MARSFGATVDVPFSSRLVALLLTVIVVRSSVYPSLADDGRTFGVTVCCPRAVSRGRECSPVTILERPASECQGRAVLLKSLTEYTHFILLAVIDDGVVVAVVVLAY
ncbi:hypothetical protein BD626DRAFT_509298 [Schizophyllum amplum]|uniref:Secreted protein n=1 Tax=Schizophyllum amplum TaxID=97359 RepID=A0A550C2W2_9AGAR|nr:hypothetical protein BD626DRAFT_509298 [Auriculariopsis ampla]